jgi:hypothetical protein
MNIPDDYAIPTIEGVLALISGISAWFITNNKQHIDLLDTKLGEIHVKLESQNLILHEHHTRRQADYEILSQLRSQMEKLTDKLQEVHLELQNKQTRS